MRKGMAKNLNENVYMIQVTHFVNQQHVFHEPNAGSDNYVATSSCSRDGGAMRTPPPPDHPVTSTDSRSALIGSARCAPDATVGLAEAPNVLLPYFAVVLITIGGTRAAARWTERTAAGMALSTPSSVDGDRTGAVREGSCVGRAALRLQGALTSGSSAVAKAERQCALGVRLCLHTVTCGRSTS